MQIFSADAAIFSKILNFLSAHENMKKPPSKNAHNQSAPIFFQ